jgi:phosphoglucomutase
MTVDHDGKIRMDCSSPYAMARLVSLKDQYRVAFANDPDSDRHGIVTPSAGLMNPNHYLAVAIGYLLTHRPHWPAARRRQDAGQQQHDRSRGEQARPQAVRSAGRLQMVRARPVRRLVLFRRRGKRRSEFPARDGTVWTTDKDGPIMDLLAAEITARTGKDPGEHFRELTAEFGTPYYTRIDAPATPEQKRSSPSFRPKR